MSTPKKEVTSFAIKGIDNYPPETITVRRSQHSDSEWFFWDQIGWFAAMQLYPKLTGFFKYTLWIGLAPKTNGFPEIHIRFYSRNLKDYTDAFSKFSEKHLFPLKFQKQRDWKKENEGTRDEKYFIIATFDHGTVWDWGVWKKYDSEWKTKYEALQQAQKPAVTPEPAPEGQNEQKGKELKTQKEEKKVMQNSASKDHSWKPEGLQLSALFRKTGLISGKQFGSVKLEEESKDLTKALFTVTFSLNAYRGLLIKEAVKGISSLSVSTEGSTYAVKIWVAYGFTVESVDQKLLEARVKAVAELAKKHNESLEKGRGGRKLGSKNKAKKAGSKATVKPAGKRGRPAKKADAGVDTKRTDENVQKVLAIATTFLNEREQAELVELLGGKPEVTITDDMLKTELKARLKAAGMTLVLNDKPIKTTVKKGAVTTVVIPQPIEALFKK